MEKLEKEIITENIKQEIHKQDSNNINNIIDSKKEKKYGQKNYLTKKIYL